jgi:hypothetical protein
MNSSPPPRRALSPKQRLALVHGTAFPTSVILNLDDREITHQFFVDNGVPPHNLAAAGVTPLVLKARGASDAECLLSLGYDALHLCDLSFCDGIVAAFGAASVVAAFLQAPLDAVSLAGSRAAERLGLSQQRLLETCAGASIEAYAVLMADPRADGIRAVTVLDTGLRAPQLRKLGWTPGSGLLGSQEDIKKLFA